MNDWETKYLGEVAELKNGKARPKNNGRYPVYGGNGILGYADDFNVKGDTVIIGRVGAYCGATYFETNECWISDNALYAKAKDNNDPLFLYYLLKQSNLNQFAGGSSHPLLTQGRLNDLNFLIPSPLKQKRISKILSSLDEKIELNRQTAQTLEAIAQAIFKEWFVDFNYPGATREMQESELGEIPREWNVKRLGEIYKTTSGGTPSRSKPEYYENGNIPWVKSKELKNSFIISTEELITDEALKKSSAKLLPKYSVLIAMYGATVGEVGIISKEASCNQAICAFIPNDEFPYTFIYQYLINNKANIISRAVGSAQQNISQELLKKIQIALPPVTVLKKYHRLVKPLFETIEQNMISSDILTETRNTLLPKLIQGEISIK